MLFVDLLDQLNKQIDPASNKALKMVGDEILRLSAKEVPHDTGALLFSGRVDDFDTYVEVGYHTPYAHRLHEHPEYTFQKGRKGKYLEDPIKNNLTRLGELAGLKIQVELL